MRRFLFIILFILSFSPFHAKASHVLGAEMAYKWISGNTYQLTLVIYGNCSGLQYNASNINYLQTSTPYVHVFDSTISVYPASGDTNMMVITLNPLTDSFKDISPYCAADNALNSCVLKGNPYDGIYRYMYTGTVTLPHTSRGWVFEYVSLKADCDNATGRQVGNNFKDDNHNNVLAINTLNNKDVGGHNSTPVFNTSKYSYVYSVNVPGTFVENVTDPDSDSLVYYTDQLYEDVDGNCYAVPTKEAWEPGYYVTNPVDTAVQPGTYNFSSATGNMSFVPTLQGFYGVTTRIVEYRNGIIVGSTLRELTLFYLPYGGGILQASIDTPTVTGATISGTDTLYTCPGSVVNFRAHVKDQQSDSIQVSFTDIIGGSNVTIDSNNSANPLIGFNWNTAGAKYGTYTLVAYFYINGCPLPSFSSHSYTVVIGNAGSIGDSILSQTQCLYKAGVRYEVQNGGVPYTITLLQGTDTLNTYKNNAVYLYDSLAAGNYTLLMQSQGLSCITSKDMVIPDNGPYPYRPGIGVSPVEYCRNGNDSALVAYLDSGATSLKWYDPSNNIIPGPVVPSTATPGTYYYTVSQVYKTCESARDTMEVIIDQDACDFDVNVHNVITPNGDGKNDLWVIDNLKFYPDTKVEVFDKLGDKVYEQEHYNNTWDGGKIPSGVYYYTVDLGKPNIITGVRTYTGYIVIKR